MLKCRTILLNRFINIEALAVPRDSSPGNGSRILQENKTKPPYNSTQGRHQ